MPADSAKRSTKSRAMRAARAWSGLKADVWAGHLGVSRATVHAYETKSEPPLEILRKAGQLAGAPLEFMENGWEALTPVGSGAHDLSQKIEALERIVKHFVDVSGVAPGTSLSAGGLLASRVAEIQSRPESGQNAAPKGVYGAEPSPPDWLVQRFSHLDVPRHQLEQIVSDVWNTMGESGSVGGRSLGSAARGEAS